MDSVLTYGAVGSAIAIGIGVVSWRMFFPWIGYDLELIKCGGAFLKDLKQIMEGDVLLIDFFEENARRQPDKPFIIFDGVQYTFKMVDEQASRVANSMKTLGVNTGETVAIMIHNEPAFVWTYLGLLKMGILTALVNYNVRKDGLLRCIRDSDAKILIVGDGKDLLDAIDEVKSDIGIPVFFQGPTERIPKIFCSFDKLMSDALAVSPSKATRANIDNNSISGYIFTSGTTGLPKAAVIRHFKNKGTACLLGFGNVSENDILYLVLPLYHTSGLIALTRAIYVGCSIVLRKKFSVTHFWDDCRKHNVTVVSYVGEVLRYLLTPPEKPNDKDHRVRLALGNGLRKDIWEKFQKRFGVKKIIEFYGATESSTFYINVNNKPGALGRHSPFLRKIAVSKQRLVKYDVNTVQPIRDDKGRCIEIKCGEVGLLLNDIHREQLPEGASGIYKGRKDEGEKKLVKNCFVEEDIFYNTGDTLYMDKEYFVYFSDRLGDTFRWKGENVSTTEVANSLKDIDDIEDANVYGVQIPGCEGRAGMATISLKDKDSLINNDILQQIQKAFESHLPKYARPLFLRFAKDMYLTPTFKQQKFVLQKEGYDLSVVKDPLFYKGEGEESYVQLTPELFSKIK